MAVKTFYLKQELASGASHLNTQDGGSAPSDAYFNPRTGWIVAKTASANYSAMLGQTERAANTFGATVLPAAASLGTNDAFRTPDLLSGDFAAGDWTLSFRIAAETSASLQDGNLGIRVYRSTSPTGSGATELTSARVETSIATDLPVAGATVSATWAAGAFSVLNEYLFFQLAWEITGASGNNGADVLFRENSASLITSTDFTPMPPKPRAAAVVQAAPTRQRPVNRGFVWLPRGMREEAAPPSDRVASVRIVTGLSTRAWVNRGRVRLTAPPIDARHRIRVSWAEIEVPAAPPAGPQPDRTRSALIVVGPPPVARWEDRRQPLIPAPRRLGDTDDRLSPTIRAVAPAGTDQRPANRGRVWLPVGPKEAPAVQDERMTRGPWIVQAARTLQRPVDRGWVWLPENPKEPGLATDTPLRPVRLVQPARTSQRPVNRGRVWFGVGSKETPAVSQERVWPVRLIVAPPPKPRLTDRRQPWIGKPRRLGNTDPRLAPWATVVRAAPTLPDRADRRQPLIGRPQRLGDTDARTAPTVRLVVAARTDQQRVNVGHIRLLGPQRLGNTDARTAPTTRLVVERSHTVARHADRRPPLVLGPNRLGDTDDRTAPAIWLTTVAQRDRRGREGVIIWLTRTTEQASFPPVKVLLAPAERALKARPDPVLLAPGVSASLLAKEA